MKYQQIALGTILQVKHQTFSPPSGVRRTQSCLKTRHGVTVGLGQNSLPFCKLTFLDTINSFVARAPKIMGNVPMAVNC